MFTPRRCHSRLSWLQEIILQGLEKESQNIEKDLVDGLAKLEVQGEKTAFAWRSLMSL
jgi:hypothetical protein